MEREHSTINPISASCTTTCIGGYDSTVTPSQLNPIAKAGLSRGHVTLVALAAFCLGAAASVTYYEQRDRYAVIKAKEMEEVAAQEPAERANRNERIAWREALRAKYAKD